MNLPRNDTGNQLAELDNNNMLANTGNFTNGLHMQYFLLMYSK